MKSPRISSEPSGGTEAMPIVDSAPQLRVPCLQEIVRRLLPNRTRRKRAFDTPVCVESRKRAERMSRGPPEQTNGLSLKDERPLASGFGESNDMIHDSSSTNDGNEVSALANSNSERTSHSSGRKDRCPQERINEFPSKEEPTLSTGIGESSEDVGPLKQIRELSLKEELNLSSDIGESSNGMSFPLSKGGHEDELQRKAIELACEKKNLFLTGGAGTGKSWTTKKIVERCRHLTIHVTAPTGIAAINVSGRTIHSWGGFQLGEEYSDFNKMMNPETREMIRKTDILLIDEISMVDGHFFDVLECMVSIIRCYDKVKDKLYRIREKNKAGDDESAIMSSLMLEMRWASGENGLRCMKPWGGIQLIVVGDFFQLPPVPNATKSNSSVDEIFEEYELESKVGRQGTYAFESHAWQRSEIQTVELKRIYRQKEAKGLCNFLNAMRVGNLRRSDEHIATLRALQNPLPERTDGVKPTRLLTRNRDVDTVNQRNLHLLEGEQINFYALDDVEFHPDYKLNLLKKHEIDILYGMPHIFGAIDVPRTPPQSLIEAREKLQELENLSQSLFAKKDFDGLQVIGKQLKECENEVLHLEEEERKNSTITVSRIARYVERLEDNEPEDLVDVRKVKKQVDPLDLFKKFQYFEEKLPKDFVDAKDFVGKNFFQNGCRAQGTIGLKEKSQVMLLWNLDVEAQLANGSRGVLEAFVPIRSYRRLLHLEVQKTHAQRQEEDTKRNMCKDHAKVLGPIKNMKDGSSSSSCRPVLIDLSNETDSDTDCEKYHESPSIDTEILYGFSSSMEEDFIDERDDFGYGDELHLDMEILDGYPSSKTMERDPIDGCDNFDYGVDDQIIQALKKSIRYLSAREGYINRELESLKKAEAARMVTLPFVRFKNGIGRLILPVPFRKCFGKIVVASRWQLPLCLAWAISIHKSQGMTIDWLHVDLSGCFACGQAYVACSRGRSVESMTVLNFRECEVKTSNKVQKFYRSLEAGVEPYTTTWSDTIEEFDRREKLKLEMNRLYQTKRCDACDAPCAVREVKRNTQNKGRLFLACSKAQSHERGHHFEWIN